MTITLEQAQTVVVAALAHGTEQGFNPLTVAVLTRRRRRRAGPAGRLGQPAPTRRRQGIRRAGARHDQPRDHRAADSPEFFTSVATLAGGKILSVPGGVFVRDAAGTLLGAVGVTGDASLNDEAAAVAGIEAAGLVPITGAEG
jgi:uncharacterized protein GlcG (DUF336 family)